MLDQDRTHEKRKLAARVFGFIALTIAILWGAYWFQNTYPQEVKVLYIFRDVSHIKELQRLEADIHDNHERRARAVFLFPKPIPHDGNYSTRQQTLRLNRGKYKLRIALVYHTGQQTIIRRSLEVKDGGTHYIHLSRNPTE
jgi:hypothetical protein